MASISPSTQSGGENLNELISPSPYDNSISFLYKKAIELGYPVRFILIEPPEGAPIDVSESFDLDENRNANFRSVFDLIRELYQLDTTITLDQVWEILSRSVQGDRFNPLELIPIWLHAIPEFRTENRLLLQQINLYRKSQNEPTPYESMTEVINNYQNEWLPRYNEEFQNDLAELRTFVASQRELINISPVHHSRIKVDSITVYYDYPAQPGVNPLPDLFSNIQNSYVIPFVQYNIRPIKGQDESVERNFKIYKGESTDTEPHYNNVVIPPNLASRGHTIYLNVWAGDDLNDISPQELQDLAHRNDRKELFYLTSITYLESSGIIRVTVNSPRTEFVNERKIIQRVHQHLPDLPEPDQTNELRLSGSFSLYGVDLIPEPIAYLIMNDRLFRSYLYLDEGSKTKTFSSKLKFNIHYRGASTESTLDQGKTKRKSQGRSALSSTLSSENIPAGEEIVILQPNGVESRHVMDKQIPSIVVTINRASSRRVVDQFVDILSRLFRRYTDEGLRILRKYEEFVPEYNLILNRIRTQQQTQVMGPAIPPSISGGQIIPTGETKKLRELQKYAPDVFVNGYARVCQKNRQPKLIRADEISVWEEQRVVRNGVTEKRQVMAFPKDTPQYYLVCTGENHPYPGVQENKKLVNKDTYPYIPCCFKNKEQASTRLNEYFGGVKKVPRKTVSRSNYIITTDRLIETDRTGAISTSVRNMLERYEDQTGKFYRYGIPQNANSFIHCVLQGLEIPEYMILKDQDKENYVRNIRMNLVQQVYPELLRQELYDMSDDEIKRILSDPNEFFDPLLFYRVMEELMNCTIYVFSKRDQDHVTGLKMSLLQLPRHKYFHSHPPTSNRPVILIMRHWGSKSTVQEHPHCELIIEQRGNEKIFRYGDSMNQILYPAMTFVARTLTWQIYETEVETPEGTQQVPEITSRMNIYSIMNYQNIFGEMLTDPDQKIARSYLNRSGQPPQRYTRETILNLSNEYVQQFAQIFGVPITSIENTRKRILRVLNFLGVIEPKTSSILYNYSGQIIDSAGKTRLFMLSPEWADPEHTIRSDLRIFVNVPPTAPLNIGSIDTTQISEHLPPYSKLIELFGEPVSATSSTDERFLTGLWFPMSDLQFGFYCPCADFSWTEFLETYPNINRNSELASLTIHIPRETQTQISPIQRIRRFERVSKFINQIVQYLYLVAGTPEEIDSFLDQITVNYSGDEDSVNIYNPDPLQRVLPSPEKSVTEILSELSLQSPQIFPGGKLLIYDEKMRRGIRYQLWKFSQDILGLDFSPLRLRTLRDYYAQKSDFKFDPRRQFVLSSLREFNNWANTYIPSSSVQQRIIQNLKNNIQTTLNVNAYTFTEPYVYQKSGKTIISSSYNPVEDKFYLIQNVAGSDLRRAIRVALNWAQEKKNTGFGTEPYNVETTVLPAHVIYRISPGGGIIVEQNNTLNSNRYLEILHYGRNLYAAMLPLI